MPELAETPVRHWVRIRGPLACFSRPEFSVERTSYPWITPSAARGVFEAILWKPRIRWEVREIQVLAPIRYISLRRNEVGDRVPTRGLGPDSRMNTDDKRQQRNTLALRDVDWLVGADLFLVRDEASGHSDDNHGKYAAMFSRRLEKGQRFHAPYLGCREFAADVQPPLRNERPLPISMEHGLMFYDYRYYDEDPPRSRRPPRPLFFDAQMVDGIIHVPPRDEVLRLLPDGQR